MEEVREEGAQECGYGISQRVENAREEARPGHVGDQNLEKDKLNVDLLVKKKLRS
jgi:hypothetical protein